MPRPFATAFLALLLSACARDTDGDGLTDVDERSLGTSPVEMDSDGDRLDDGQEVERGTDPLVYDSDGDGYADGDEVTEGTDPSDADSVIYLGGWPYYWDKDSIPDPGFDEPMLTGGTMPRYRAVDGYGQEVDIYDFAGQGWPVMVQVSVHGGWLSEVIPAALVGGEERDNFQLPGIFSAYDRGELLWVVVEFDDSEAPFSAVPPMTSAGVAAAQAANPAIPRLMDADDELQTWVRQDLGAISHTTFIWLRDDMRIQRAPSASDPSAEYNLQALEAFYASQTP